MNATESDGDHPQCGQNEEIEFVVKCGAGLESQRSPEWPTRSARAVSQRERRVPYGRGGGLLSRSGSGGARESPRVLSGVAVRRGETREG